MGKLNVSLLRYLSREDFRVLTAVSLTQLRQWSMANGLLRHDALRLVNELSSLAATCSLPGRRPTRLRARFRNRGRLENRSHVVPKTGFQDGGDRTRIFTHKIIIFA